MCSIRPIDSKTETLLVPVPTVEEIVSGIELKVTFKDVTYESLNKPGLPEELKRAFQAIDWARPFSQFEAAQETNPIHSAPIEQHTLFD